MQDDAGGQILIEITSIYDNMDGTETARPDQDIAAVVISYASYTALEDSGIGLHKNRQHSWMDPGDSLCGGISPPQLFCIKRLCISIATK